MKHCIDCRHCRQYITYYPLEFGIGRRVNYGSETCARTDLIYGNGDAGINCTVERMPGGDCGPDGDKFERKPIKVTPIPKCRGRWWQLFGTGKLCEMETLSCEPNEYEPSMESGFQWCVRCGKTSHFIRERKA